MALPGALQQALSTVAMNHQHRGKRNSFPRRFRLALRFKVTTPATAPAVTSASDKSQPIDVPHGQLFTWLIDNHKLAGSFPKELQAIRSKLSSMGDVLPLQPEFDEFRQRKDSLTFFDCSRIFDLLREKDPQKSLLGTYTNPTVREWSALVKSYTHNNVHLGDSAQRLSSMILNDMSVGVIISLNLFYFNTSTFSVVRLNVRFWLSLFTRLTSFAGRRKRHRPLPSAI